MAEKREEWKDLDGTGLKPYHYMTDADIVNIEDKNNKISATNVEGALEEIVDKIDVLKNNTTLQLTDNTIKTQATQNTANTALNKANEAFQLGDSTRKNVVSILSSKGLEGLTTNSTWADVTNVMQNMSLGKKWAKINIDTFTVKDFKNNMGRKPIPTETAKIRGLNFKPSVILFHWKLEKCNYGDVVSFLHSYSYLTATNPSYYENIVNHEFPNGGDTDLTAINVSYGGFDCEFNISKIPIEYSSEMDMVVTEVYCIAYE